MYQFKQFFKGALFFPKEGFNEATQ